MAGICGRVDGEISRIWNGGLTDLREVGGREPKIGPSKKVKSWRKRVQEKDGGESSSEKLCKVFSYLFYNRDPQTTALKINFYTKYPKSPNPDFLIKLINSYLPYFPTWRPSLLVRVTLG